MSRSLESWHFLRQTQLCLVMFQASTNASLKNLESQVGQLALAVHNQSKDSFPSDTKKNAKDCMALKLRSGKELKRINEVEMKHTKAETEKIYPKLKNQGEKAK